ncbi:ATP-binding protein [Vibrio alfacsensis]|uniref:ATP-binding protein n=1 Tax=Vibrio alfacsensis TaxID=1074311 RepID=UPI002ADE0388|nr:ATP-binding protein [Vibrio alfacsensis]WQE75385.1 ATP-binding protein [Vibrio alfacsensis]
MLLKGEVDVIPIVKRDDYNPKVFLLTNDLVPVKYVLIETLIDYDVRKYAVLDRFGSFKRDYNTSNYIFYTDVESLLEDVRSGYITHAYINQYLVESILNDFGSDDFKVVLKNDALTHDSKAPMLLRKGDAKLALLIDEAFSILTERELDNILDNYSKVNYHIGYKEKDIKTAVTLASVFIVFLLMLGALFISRTRKQIDGEIRKTELSETQRRLLIDIVDNIPSYVCIMNKSGEIILSNNSYNQFKDNYYHGNELDPLQDILEKSEVEVSGDKSKYLRVIDSNHSLYGRHFHVVNQSIVHAIDEVDLFMTVITDVTELKERERYLLQANELAEAAVQQKQNFLAIISHELRTPISGILGLMELLGERVDDQIGQEILHNASASTSKLKLLVDDILDFSKLEAHQLRVHLESHNLANELSPIIKGFESLALNKGLSFYVDWIPTRYLEANIDLLRVSQIISNVLSNAVKFTEIGSVKCHIEQSQHNLTIEIKDMGIGMDEEELKNIFDPFVQAQDNIARRYGGTGLGMSIVNNLVDLMGGEVEIASAKSLGTSVVITIPVESKAFSASPISQVLTTDNAQMSSWLGTLEIEHDLTDGDNGQEQVRKNFYPDEVMKLLSSDTKSKGELALTIGEVKPLQGNVLVVDDDPINRFLIKMQLETLGVNAIIVHEGKDALDIIDSKEHQFDALITDCHMPGLNGFELTRRVRESDSDLSPLPVIAFTADNSEATEIKAEKVQMDSILYKPYELLDLYNALKEVLPTKSLESAIKHAPESKVGRPADWLSRFDGEDKDMMAQAVVDSLQFCLNGFNSKNVAPKEVIHRLKGSASALALVDITQLCEKLELDPANKALFDSLIEKIHQVLDEANSYLSTKQ